MPNVDLVVKIGGAEGIDLDPLLAELAALIRSGERIVIVHGGSHATTELARALGHPPRFITSASGRPSRRTDRKTLEAMAMACAGGMNTAIVESLRRLGVSAVGLTGLDAGIWIGPRKDAIRAVEDGRTVIIRDDLSGAVERVDANFLTAILDTGRTPVLCPPAGTPDGIAINVDADRAAAATAAALGARELLLLTNVAGVLDNPQDPTTLIERVAPGRTAAVRAAAHGRMQNKVQAAEEALAGSVARVVIAQCHGTDAIASARAGRGTVFEGAIA
jgi:acetylglutamate/LysW-gamma-L-alpha-aminoadipate kinase